MVILELKRWDMLIKVNRDAKKFQKEGCKHFDKMTPIYGDTYVTEVDGYEISPSPLPHGKKPKKDSFATTMSNVMASMTDNTNVRAEQIERAIKKLHHLIC
ncbi:uncharacterized protein LOC132294999 [Cornus florida]|uniref:uncharacterized protein LOC132294999 n=1 Tax=Cornus florida TaxID=4283 RepID=UPI002898713D|nr:uncharacterized protein LOC132294999 [Cornus florida]